MKSTPRLTLQAGALIAGLSLAVPASADMFDDFFEGKVGNWPAVTYSGSPFNLKFSHPAPPVSVAVPIWQKSLGVISLKTNGKMNFTEFGAGTLHGPRDGFKAAREGLTDYAACYPQFEGRGFELTRVFEQPFVSPPNPMVTSRVIFELVEKYFKPEYDRAEVYFGYKAGFTPTDIMSKRPIRRLEDVRGMKLVAQGFPQEAAAALGATFVNIPFPEIYTALQQGVADGVVWVDAGFIPYKVYELAKFHTTVGLTGGGVATCFSKTMFDKLPGDLKRAFYYLQQQASMAMTYKTQIEYSRTARETYKQNGVELITLPDAELARWKAALKPVTEKWAAEQEAARRPARALLADIEKLIAKYKDITPEAMFRLSLEQPVQGIVNF